MSTLASLSPFQRMNLRFYYVGVLLIVALLIAGSFRPMMDNVDIGWHVAQGRWMAQHGVVYQLDEMNYSNFGRPLINEYPLFQLVLYFFWRLGWWGPCLLTAAIYASLGGALARAGRIFLPGGSALFLVSMGAMTLYLQLSFVLRPQLVTYLCLTILGIFLLRHRQAARFIDFWPIGLMQIAWTNCHGAFVLGPILVGLFGMEMILRSSLEKHGIAWAAVRVWTASFLLILLACLVNPFGFHQFYPPLYQGSLESIRAYVFEMRPLTGTAAALYGEVTLITVLTIGLAAFYRRGAISFSFLFLAIVLYVESLSTEKSWPIFGVLCPLLVLSCGAFGSERSPRESIWWCSLAGTVAVSSLVLAALVLRLEGASPSGLRFLWQEYNAGRGELPSPAVKWMLAHGIEGRLFHRCEDGGYLQLAGYDHGEVFGDSGFGKYSESLIHTVVLAGERPALLPMYLATYRPDYVLTNNFCFQWPFYLRQQGWRLIFYSPYGMVWTRPETRIDLPTVAARAIQDAFAGDIAQYGRPADLLLYGRNIIALNSLGLEEFAVGQLTSAPDELHHAPWYWEGARILCFEAPRISSRHRQLFVAEAERLHDDVLTAEFRAYTHFDAGDAARARRILSALRLDQLSSSAGDLLLKINLKQPKQIDVVKNWHGFDPRDGDYWRYAAHAEEQAGLIPAAARDWKRAVFYYPDKPDLLLEAQEFASKYHDQTLAHSASLGAVPIP